MKSLPLSWQPEGPETFPLIFKSECTAATSQFPLPQNGFSELPEVLVKYSLTWKILLPRNIVTLYFKQLGFWSHLAFYGKA